MNKLLIIDDEKDVLELLKDYFEFKNYEVITAANGEEGISKIASNPDLILLDIAMPGKDGIEVCKIIRDLVSCPILFLTAKIDNTEKIMGLKVGGDDYIVKPFDIQELEARIEAHLRREQRVNAPKAIKVVGDLTINFSEKTIVYTNQTLTFTKKEFDIIELLSLNVGQVFDKEYIYEKIWGYDGEGDSKVIVEHIRRIRNKLFEATNKEYIKTLWGMGYKWEI